MPEGVGKEVDVAGVAHELGGARGVGGDGVRAFAGEGDGAHVAAGEDGQVAAVFLRHVG